MSRRTIGERLADAKGDRVIETAGTWDQLNVLGLLKGDRLPTDCRGTPMSLETAESYAARKGLLTEFEIAVERWGYAMEEGR